MFVGSAFRPDAVAWVSGFDEVSVWCKAAVSDVCEFVSPFAVAIRATASGAGAVASTFTSGDGAV